VEQGATGLAGRRFDRSVGQIKSRARAPDEVIQTYFDDPIEGEDVVEFRLLYGGDLPSATGTKTRAKLKHAIRKEFHLQLRNLWHGDGTLKQLAMRTGILQGKDGGADFSPERRAEEDIGTPAALQAGLHMISQKWERNGYSFVPLVTRDLSLRCAMDILFLRPEDPNLFSERGDLDARLKTIFDALRMPANLNEAGGVGPAENEHPFFLLLEDDKLVTEVRVVTDKLLFPPKTANDAFLVIHVKLKPTRPLPDSWVFA
jgi:hypothetical protein